ncbi:major facilitator superfamily domain-containing protein, partial [Mucor mucedo]|uniref:major facilitator superfamily domain-containing protein n=1 Tax=Mucor mucedo TaxID=29922 RepID=UPI00221EAD41
RKKWFILLIVALQGFLGPLSSSIYVPAIVQVKQSFGASNTSINATISLYVFTMGLSPLLWASLSERHGRRAIYLLSTLLYIIATIGCALTYSVIPFIVLRAFQAIGASAAQAVGAGTITDLFDIHERGNAMGLFLLGPLIGPVVGPIAGGFINELYDWRYIFWFLAIMGGVVFLLMLVCLPETSAKILRKREKYKEKGYLDEDDDPQESILKSMARPFQFITKPVVILATTPYSMAYGFMYFVISSLPHQLALHYGFSSYQIGLAFLANGVGNALGALASGKMSDRALGKVVNPENRVPELRLRPMWIGILLLPAGQLIYGWCTQLNIHVMASLSGLFLLGLGVGVVQTPSNTYIVDAYQKHSASVMSAANLLRCISAGCTPLIAPTLIEKIGNGWSMTLLSVLSVMSGICIFFISRYGSKWRQKDLADS